MKLFRWFTKNIESLAVIETYDAEPVTEQAIVVGSIWAIKPDNGDPFPSAYRKLGVAAHVLAVKDGWVRYSMGPPSMSIFPDNRREIGDFLRLYEPY